MPLSQSEDQIRKVALCLHWYMGYGREEAEESEEQQ